MTDETGPILTGRYDPDELPFPEQQFIYYASYTLRAIMLNEAGYESCVLTAKLVSELFRRLGITCIPIMVQVDAFNPAAWERALRGDKVQAFADPDDDAFICQILHDTERHSPDALQGHMAVIVGNRYLVDASIDQLSRPTRSLYIEPVVLTFGQSDDDMTFEDFLGGEQASVLLAHGGAIVYTPHPDDLEYLNGLDWEPLEEDSIYQRVLDSALGLVSVALDTGEFPPLPPLPTSISKHYGDVVEAVKAGGLAPDEAKEVFMRHGFKIEDYAGQIEAVVDRMQRRQAASA